MAAETWRGVNGVNRRIKEIYRGEGGVNRKMKEVWRGVNGVNRKVFSSGIPISYTFYTTPEFSTGAQTTISYSTADKALTGRVRRGSTVSGEAGIEFTLPDTITSLSYGFKLTAKIKSGIANSSVVFARRRISLNGLYTASGPIGTSVTVSSNEITNMFTMDVTAFSYRYNVIRLCLVATQGTVDFVIPNGGIIITIDGKEYAAEFNSDKTLYLV